MPFRADLISQHETSVTYFAHTLSDKDIAKWEILSEHLTSVASLARNFGSGFNADQWGEIAGLWHDLGKYSDEFQAYLKHETGFDLHCADYVGRVDHSTAGAQHAVATLGTPGRILAYCIAGHHAGLADSTADSGTSSLAKRLSKEIKSYSAAPDELLTQPALPNPKLTLSHGDKRRAAFQLGLFTRMLFSCLVDADFLATESFMSPGRAKARPTDANQLPNMLEALDRKIAELQPASETVVSRARADVVAACRSQASLEPGLFSLTVPTGGGKTLSSLAFALQHAVAHDKRRIIYAIPFTSIIEQTANVFRGMFDELSSDIVLEHHSNTDPDSDTVRSRLASENWDAPLVVTTNVQLFESLFASRTSRCRKLHRIVNSVIILDEAQCIPVDLLEPTLAVIRELVEDYGCTIVLCTATQPAIVKAEDFPIGLSNVREIISQPRKLYDTMKRVEVQQLGKLTDTEVVEQMQRHDRFLCIVNTRPHAARLFAALDDESEGTFHLSTFMCGQHRSDVLDEIRDRLNRDLPCRVVSTQLIEAGVDVDFPVVFRALTGADSIAQAAGRCNREGKLERGAVYVFDPVDIRLRGYLRSIADSTSELLGDRTDVDLLDLDTMQEYFQLHYYKRRGGDVRANDGWDRRDVMGCFPPPMNNLHFNFATAAERYRWIDDTSKTVFVPYGGEGKQLLEALRAAIEQPPSRRLLRKLQRYSVGLYERVFNSMVGTDIELLENGHAVLLNNTCYDNRLGFRSDLGGFHEPETLVL